MIDFNEEEYKKAQAFDGETVKLPAGGYICKILNAKNEKSKAGKKMLSITIDIAEGEFSGFFMNQYENIKKTSTPDNPAKFPNNGVHRYVLEGDYWLNRLKGLMTSLEKSNPNFDWLKCNHDESKIIGLQVGAIFCEEEYERMDGSIGTTTKVTQIRSTEIIKEGNYTIPEKKKLEKTEDPFDNVGYSNEELPF